MPPKIINVPKTDPGAYKPDRPAGTLLIAQAHHLREALRKKVADANELLNLDMKSLKTEGQVSEFVRKVTEILHGVAIKRRRK